MDRRALDEFIERARGLSRRPDIDEAAAVVLGAFEEANIRSLLLKGPVLARLLYLERETRGYSDVDVLVDPDHLDRAREALAALGYKRAGGEFGVDDVAGIQNAELWARPGPLWIDLHWRLDGCDAPPAAVWASMAAHHRFIDVSGRPVPVPGLPGLAVHAALHAAQHGPADLKAMGDLRRALERWPLEVWRAAALVAVEAGATPGFAAGLRLDQTGAILADQLSLPAAAELDWEIRNRGTRPRGTFHLRALAEAQTLRERVGLLRRSLIPSPQWIRWEFRWADRSRPLLIVAYAYHIVRSPRWALSAFRYVREVSRAGRR